MKIPTNIADITPEWLSETFAASGAFGNSSITTIEHESLSSEGQEFAGLTCRLNLTYHVSENGAPESVIVKMSSPDPEMRKRISVIYKREVDFYTKVASKTDVCAPHCYHAAFDNETGHSVLLLEDLRNGQTGDMLRGGSRREMSLAIEHLVPLHASWWHSPALKSTDTCTVKDDLFCEPELTSLYKSCKFRVTQQVVMHRKT